MRPMLLRCVTALAVLTAVSAVDVSGAGAASVIPNVSKLGTPFNQWHVQIQASGSNQHVWTLTFDSPLLGGQVTNTVYVPDGYRARGPASPVIYSLHGTVVSGLDNCALNAVTGLETLLNMMGCGGGYIQDQFYDIASQLQSMHFLVVSPDTSPTHVICETCVWINGQHSLLPTLYPLTAKQVPADSFLHDELYPLIQTLFNVRTDRGGRGVIGFSMGGWAAALQAMIHPDDYSYLGWVSGGYDTEEPAMETGLEAVGYLRDQGYGVSPLTDPVWWAQYDPMDLASNIHGVEMGFLLSSGDACLSAGALTAPECQGRFSPARSPGGVAIETLVAHNRQIAVQDLSAKRIPFTTVQTPGTHGANNSLIFAKYIVPEANAIFSTRVAAPRTFSYQSAMPSFSVWGYSVSVTRSELGFLSLIDAASNGRHLTLRGNGTVSLTTPAVYSPRRGYKIAVSENGTRAVETATASSSGRLTITVNLEESAAASNAPSVGNGKAGAGTTTATVSVM